LTLKFVGWQVVIPASKTLLNSNHCCQLCYQLRFFRYEPSSEQFELLELY